MKRAYHILIIIFSGCLIGCGTNSSNVPQGKVFYKVTYPKMDMDNLLYDFMPKEMVLTFKGDRFVTSLSAGMGMFELDFIVDESENEFSQLVKMINKKYALSLQGDGIIESLENLPKFNIEYSDETKEILNYVCKKAVITIDDGSNDAFTVYYTDAFTIYSPNWSSQFKEIDGLMLEYQYEKYGICMRFEAQKIEFTEVTDEEFEIDPEYASISENDLNNEMQELFDSFN